MTFRDLKQMSGEFVEPSLECDSVPMHTPQPDNSALAFRGNESFLGLESPGFGGLSSTQLSPYVHNQNFNPNNWLALHFDSAPLSNSPFLNYNLSLPFQGVNPLISPSLDLTCRNPSLISPNLIQPYNTPALPFLSPSVMGSGLDFLSPNYLVLFDSKEGFPEPQRYTAPTDILNTPTLPDNPYPNTNFVPLVPMDMNQALQYNLASNGPSPLLQDALQAMNYLDITGEQFVGNMNEFVSPLPPNMPSDFQTPIMYPAPFPTPITGFDAALQAQMNALVPTFENCTVPSTQNGDMNEPLIPSHMNNVHSFITSQNELDGKALFEMPTAPEPLIFPGAETNQEPQTLSFSDTLGLTEVNTSSEHSPSLKRLNEASEKSDKTKRLKPAISVLNFKALNQQRILPYTEAHASQSLEGTDSKESKPKRRYVCDFPGCGLTFSRLYNSKTHCETHYPDRVKAHPCPECSRRFDRKHDLGRHLQTVHRKERKHVCETCGKNFSRGDALMRHIGTPECVAHA